MSYRRPTKGVHQIYGDAQVAGDRWVTCACGLTFSCFDRQTAWTMWWKHSQDPAHR